MQYLFPLRPVGMLVGCSLALLPSCRFSAGSFRSLLRLSYCQRLSLGSISGWALYDTGRPTGFSHHSRPIRVLGSRRLPGGPCLALYRPDFLRPLSLPRANFPYWKDCAPLSRRRPGRPDRAELRRWAISCEFVEEPFLRLKNRFHGKDAGGCRAGGAFGGKAEAV
jgi:hypothetical protein